MASEKRIPRVRIHEDSFSEEIKNPSYPKECVDEYDGPIDFFIEVINAKDEVIALFFQYYPLKRNDFRDVLEYAEYYDSLDLVQWEEDEWRAAMEAFEVTTKDEYWQIVDKYGVEYEGGDKTEYSCFRKIAIGIIMYGRLKYPLGLNNEDRKYYLDEVVDSLIGDTKFRDLVDGNKIYTDDLIDFVNFSLIQINLQESAKSLSRLLTEFYIFDFIYSGIEILSGVADNLLTQDNIDQFIDIANSDGKTEIIAFLLDYKNKHFPANG